MTVRHLEFLFRPASVALIGASGRPGSVGAVVLANLRAGGFKGPIWPVNHRHARVNGEPAWPDVASLPQAPDLAVICTPPHTVPGLVADLGRRGTRAVIVITAGLSASTADGSSPLVQQALDAARPHLLRVLGPNCLGLLVPALGLNASFAPGGARPGPLAFVTQSGALATAMLDWAGGQNIGFSHFVSMGDCADVDFGDVLDYLGSDSGTRAILLYIESVQSGRKFMSAARAAARNKPVIVVKAGRMPAGARAAASHTGALAGSDSIFDAAIRRAGMLRVDTLEALFDAAETLAYARPQRGERLAILTNGGGAGVLAADSLAMAGGTLADLCLATRASLDACLPATWSQGNPVDIIGDAPAERYAAALGVLLQAPEVDAVLFIHAPTAVVSANDIAALCVPLFIKADKPVLTCWLGGPAVAAARQACAAAGISTFPSPERATAAWMQRVLHARNQEALQQIAPAASVDFRPDLAAARHLMAQAGEQGQAWLDEMRAKRLLQAYGIPVVQTRTAVDADEAAAVAGDIGFPVALKILSPQVLHKSDVGGVALGLDSTEAVRSAAHAMMQRVRQIRPDASLQGFTVQAMAQRDGARELILGVTTDPVFGPVILLGAGGTDVELHRDHAVGLPPLNARLAADLIDRSGLAPYLANHRGRPAADRGALIDTLLKLSRMVCDLAPLVELDINPLLIDASGVMALDARVRMLPPGAAPRTPLAILPYPVQLEESLELGGQALELRPIRPDDGERLRAFYAAATPADMRLRFFMSRREVPLAEVARFTQIDYDREMALVALLPGALDPRRLVGQVRAVCDPDNQQAEFAIQIATDWQGRGLGRLLLGRMVDWLRSRGTAEMVGECLLENRGMLELARKAGFETGQGADGGTVRLRLLLR
ncbi:MAG: bifunctional acetate--CoA ligase family protein/GNAT family N-acetyltransferase [Ramlibacter sp.]